MRSKHLGFILSIAVFLPMLCSVALVSAATVSLPATGQTKCYQGVPPYAEISCSGTGQDGDKKMGVAWPNPRFTVSGECVTDNLTGLLWAKNANLPNGKKTWQQALDYVASLNASGGLCGYTDWRLPQVLELESLLHAGYNAETCGVSACSHIADWLNTQGFTNAQNTLYSYYWSSSTSSSYTRAAACVSMYSAGSMSSRDKTESLYVWPVRASAPTVGGGQSTAPAEVRKTGLAKCYNTTGTEIACTGTKQDGDTKAGVAWPSPRFTDNGNGTVTDNLTGLIWLKNTNCFDTKTWQAALDLSNGLANSQCGLSDGSQAGDWRLPNYKELLSLQDFSNTRPVLPANHPFTYTYTQPDHYWSSSNYVSTYTPSESELVRIFSMSLGIGSTGVKTNSYYVWPVRGGQSGSSSQNNCAASVSSSLVVHIPIVTYSGANYYVDLQYNSSDSTLTLVTGNAVSDMSSYSSCTASTLSSDLKLHVPVVMLSDVSYWLDLQWNGSAFAITGAGQN